MQNEYGTFHVEKKGNLLCEITKKYNRSINRFPADEDSVGMRIDVYQESIDKMFIEYLVHFEYFKRLMEDYGFFQSWAAVFCAIVGTIIWRIAGVVLASRIPADGPVMGWVNTMAYAMVSAVLLLILVHPTGVLATTGLDHRLIGLGAGLLAMFISKRLIFSLLCGISAFALAIQLV